VELDWTTFLLEALNFLILVWILKRFLYRPILDVIAQRRTRIEGTLADAKKIQDEALELKTQNERQLKEWDIKQESVQLKLTEEISVKRDRMMADLAADIEREREKNAALEKVRHQEWMRSTETRALVQARRFSASLLSRLASTELEAKLFDIFLEDLQKLTTAETTSLIGATDRSEIRIHVASAFPLPADRQTRLVETLTKLVGKILPAEFSEDPSLISGIKISVGPWVLHANLRDELAFFHGNNHGLN
jgi:F-type H+-transporting ATPase subunit b